MENIKLQFIKTDKFFSEEEGYIYTCECSEKLLNEIQELKDEGKINISITK